MRKIILIFFSISILTFAIPDFNKLNWGFNKNAIQGYYPKLEKSFATGDKVTKFNYYPTNSQFKKITFYLYEEQLYKIVKEFDTNKIKPTDVKKIYDGFTIKWGQSEFNPIDEKYDDFSIKGNEQTWIKGSTYISLIGEDKFNKNNIIEESSLAVEYGIIDPAKRKDSNSLNKLILDN